MTYRVLDLFSGAGGCAVGYSRAGFEVVGVDNKNQPRYPFQFVQDDALELLDMLLMGAPMPGLGWYLDDFDAIHASPPCQFYCPTTPARTRGRHPDLIPAVRQALEDTGLPYIIENVPGAPLSDPIVLCGSMFNLRVKYREQDFGLQRHRLFELRHFSVSPMEHNHSLPSITVTGTGTPSGFFYKWGFAVPLPVKRDLMGIPWMSLPELSESIPPAYTEYVGIRLRQYLDSIKANDSHAVTEREVA